MRNGEGVHGEVADFKRRSGAEDAVVKSDRALRCDGFHGEAVAKNGYGNPDANRCQALDMVGVFVGNQDPIQRFRSPTDLSQTLANLAATESGVDEDASLFGFEICAVTAGAAAQDCESNGHS